MNPDQALQVLDQAVSLATLNRQGHIAVQQALEVLVKFVKDHTPAQSVDGGSVEV